MSAAAVADRAADRFFERLLATYNDVAGERGREVLDLAVAGTRVRVTVASRELAESLIPPLERLRGGPGVPNATLCAWDSASTGSPGPPLPWEPGDVRADGTVAGFDDGRFRCLYREDGGGFPVVAMFDQQQRIGVFWYARHDRIHWYERAEPLRPGLHWALQGPDRFLAHASAVGDAHGAVVLTGRGGAGKTTATLASVGAGLRFVGDNHVLVALDRDRPWVHGLYGNVKLWPETLERLPELRPFVRSLALDEDEKLVIDVARYRPVALVGGLPIRAVVVPEVRGSGPTELLPCSPVQALLALAPTTIFGLPRTERPLERMGRLVRGVPTFRLLLGGDVRDGPRAIAGLLDGAGG